MSALHPEVLIIGADPQVHRYVRSALKTAGYRPTGVDSGELGLARIAARAPEAVVLDLDLRGVDGQALLAQVRAALAGPLLVVSSSGRLIETIDALDLGADAVFAKPFSAEELLARLRVAFRQRIVGAGHRALVEAEDVTIDLVNRTVRKKARAVALTAQQYWILARLVKSGGGVVTHQDLIAGDGADAGAKTMQNVRFLVRQLRAKLEQDLEHPRVIKTEHGIGYRLAVGKGESPSL